METHMSDILNQIKRLEQTNQTLRCKVGSIQQASLKNAADDANTTRSLIGKIVLDPSKDPDPYSLHGIPLTTRLIEMGWR